MSDSVQTFGFGEVILATSDVAEAVGDYQQLLGVAAAEDRFALDNISLRFEAAAADYIAGFSLRVQRDDVEGLAQIGSHESLTAIDLGSIEEKAADRLAGPPAVVPGADAVHGIDHLVIRSRDVDATRDFYAGSFGLRVLFDREFPDWKVRLCMCRVGDAVLEIAGRLEDDRANRGAESDEAAARDRLWGVTWRVADLDAAHQRLEQAGVSISEVRTGRRPGTRVATVKSHSCGVPTLLIEPAA